MLNNVVADSVFEHPILLGAPCLILQILWISLELTKGSCCFASKETLQIFSRATDLHIIFFKRRYFLADLHWNLKLQLPSLDLSVTCVYFPSILPWLASARPDEENSWFPTDDSQPGHIFRLRRITDFQQMIADYDKCGKFRLARPYSKQNVKNNLGRYRSFFTISFGLWTHSLFKGTWLSCPKAKSFPMDRRGHM